MDYVDIAYHHMVSRRESAFHEPAMNAMVKAKEAGKARSRMDSNFFMDRE